MFQFLLILSIFLGVISHELRAESSIEQIQSQAAQIIKSASGLSKAQMAVSLILPKFYPDKNGNPAVWKLVSDPDGSGKPRVSASAFVADSGITNWAASWAGKDYVVDPSGLATLRKVETLANPDDEQDGFIGISVVSGLSDAQVDGYFNDDTTRFPASQDAFHKTPIQFKSISTGTDGLRYLNVQVGSMNVDIPVPVIGGWYQEAYIKASNADAEDRFGQDVAISGDTIVVSAGHEDSAQSTITNGTTASTNNSLPMSNAVYVYRRTGSTWVQEAYLKPSNNKTNNTSGIPPGPRFGDSVSISGNTIVVGAQFDSSSQTTITNGTTGILDVNSSLNGAAYVFKRTGNTWVQEAYLKAPQAEEYSYFGNSAISGDIIAVTKGDFTGASGHAGIYLYQRTHGQWELGSFLKPVNYADGFGVPSISGDTLVVGSPYDDSSQTTITNGTAASTNNSATDSGAAYVFRKTGDAWIQEAYLKAPNADADDNFGWRASISGDTIVVGSRFEDGNQTTITNGTTASSNDSTSNSGAAYVFRKKTNGWAQEAYLKAPNLDINDWFSWSLSISGDTITVGSIYEASNQTTITNGPTASSNNSMLFSGAVYVFKRLGDTWAQEAYLKAVNNVGCGINRTSSVQKPGIDLATGCQGDHYGVSAISGDTIVVGAQMEDSNQTTITNGTFASTNNTKVDSGAVYVYRRSEVSSTPLITRVTPSTAFCPGHSIVIFGSGFMKDATVQVGDQACISQTTQGPNEIVCELPRQPVAIPGDLLSITVTNPNGEVSTLNDSFSCDGWYQEAYIKAPNAGAGDDFGWSISISGDTAVLGAWTEDSNQTTITNGTTANLDNSKLDTGAAYVFKRTGKTWNQEGFLKAPNADASDNFGADVAISGNTIVVGAPNEDSNQTTITNGTAASADNSLTNSGAAYVFQRLGTNWIQEAYLKAPNADSGDLFSFANGHAGMISGDTIVLGSMYEDSNQTTLTNGTTASADNSLVSAGAVYVFRRTANQWVREAYLKASNAGLNDLFGWPVAISGDTIVVSSMNEDSNQTTITNGTTASIDNSSIDSGAVYVFKRSGSVWGQEAYLKPSNSGSGDQFGFTLSVSGDTIVVGSWGEDSNQTTITNGTTASTNNSLTDSGAVYVFKRTGSSWAQEAYLKTSNIDANDQLGHGVAISGNTIVVGTRSEDSDQSTITNGSRISSNNSKDSSGAAYVFKRTGSSWAQEAYLKAPNPDADDRFSRSVAISGDTIMAGSRFEDSNQTTITNGQTGSSDNSATDSGAVYVFRRPEKDATPNITYVTPTQVFCPGSSINIFGSGFMKNARASVDGIDCLSTTVQGPNEIICKVPQPPSPEGSPLPVVVTNPNGKYASFLDSSDWVRNTTVDAKLSDWMPAGITVTKGKPLSITASGRAGDGVYSNFGPNGVPNTANQASPCRVKNKYNGSALLGKIGKDGAIFLIGSSYSQSLAEASGELYLALNDLNCAFDNSGGFNVTITAPKAFNCDLPNVPVITIDEQPTDQTADTNGTVTFTVSAQVTGGATIQYQWQESSDGSVFNNISGATSPLFTLSGVTASRNNYRYRVVLSSSSVTVTGFGSVAANPVTSNSAVLSVPTPPVVCPEYEEQVWSIPGTYSISPPSGCYSYVSAVCIGGGGGREGTGDDASGGGGGGLVWFKNRTLNTSDKYSIQIGAAGAYGTNGSESNIKLNGTFYMRAYGGSHGGSLDRSGGSKWNTSESGITFGGGAGGDGGAQFARLSGGGGGGAGGYQGDGGNGGNGERSCGTAGAKTAGAGGGGGAGCERCGRGGGTGLYGKGTSGAGGCFSGNCKTDEMGEDAGIGSPFQQTQSYGGGRGGGGEYPGIDAQGGACRIVFSKTPWDWSTQSSLQGVSFSIKIRLQSSRSNWTNTKVTVTQGKSLNISASGSVDFGAGYNNIAPEGTATAARYQYCKFPEAISFNGGALLGKIGLNGTPFLIGPSYSVSLSPASGELYIGMNDPNCAGDNNGHFDVDIQAGR